MFTKDELGEIIDKKAKFVLIGIYGNILATENRQVKINDVIEVKIGLYLHKT